MFCLQLNLVSKHSYTALEMNKKSLENQGLLRLSCGHIMVLPFPAFMFPLGFPVLHRLRQAAEQYAWLVVGRYAFPHTIGIFSVSWSVAGNGDSSAASTGSTAFSKYLQ